MMKKLLRFLMLPVLLGMVFFLPGQALAIPSLGVAPSTSNPGIYYGTPADGSDGGTEWLEAYQNYFVSGAVPVTGDNGFSMPASGDELTVWWGENNGAMGTTELGYDIWLVTNSAAGAGFSFGGVSFNPVDTNIQVDGYQSLVKNINRETIDYYYAVNLSNVSNTSSNWSAAPSGSPFDSPKEFYFNTDVINSVGFNYGSEWMFAVANPILVEPGILDSISNFSPKTTSASYPSAPIPEPATMLLLGAGLIGLAGFRRKFKK